MSAPLPILDSFSAILDFSRYWSVPDDWAVFVCDIRNSTIAIEKGQYKQVNALGASAIIAVANAVKPEEALSVFGGDGATFLCPPELIDATTRALLGVQRLAKEAFSFDLRVALIPARDLKRQGAPVKAALIRLSPHITQVAFSGSGIALADLWAKQPPVGKNYTVKETSFVPPADLSGLECRWAPVRSQRGNIVSILVQSLSSDQNSAADDYRDVVELVDKLLGTHANPLGNSRLRLSFRFNDYRTEGVIRRWFGPISSRSRHALFAYLLTHTVGFLWKTFFRKSGKAYKEELIENSDFRKFDGTLRMVIDLSDSQQIELVHLLETKRAGGRIAFGTHTSKSAIVTCLIFDRKAGKHLHFVDGSDGGYAVAARALKKQLAESAARPRLAVKG
jgi:hypothetical protein